MTQEQNTLQQQVMDRAMNDEAFRQELLNNPKGTLERELGLALPAGVTIQVHENTPIMVHLVLPMLPASGELRELSDVELETVVGGAASSNHSGHTHSGHGQGLL